MPWDLSALLAARQSQMATGTAATHLIVTDDKILDLEMKTVQEILCRFRQISPDGTECGCLKAIVLFKPGLNLISNVGHSSI
jgi:hypothetical protein